MRAVIQRVSSANVAVEGKKVSEISKGFLILLGVEPNDNTEDIEWLSKKVSNLRVFADARQQMNLNINLVNGSFLVVSQFTLHASTKKGNRPSFIKAAQPKLAEALYLQFCKQLEEVSCCPVSTGVFGANMQISLVNDGPVTIIIDTKNKE